MHYFTVGKYRLAAGLSWSVLTGGRPGRQLRALTGRRNPCVLVRQGEMQYAGVGEGRERAWSVAVAALPALGQNGYALIKLPDERWLFLAAVDGMPALQGDITGDSVTCIRARDRFLAFHDAPVSGWQETGTEAAPADITALLPPRLPAAARLFIPGQRVRRCLLVGLAAVAIWYAWDYWQGVQRRNRRMASVFVPYPVSVMATETCVTLQAPDFRELRVQAASMEEAAARLRQLLLYQLATRLRDGKRIPPPCQVPPDSGTWLMVDPLAA